MNEFADVPDIPGSPGPSTRAARPLSRPNRPAAAGDKYARAGARADETIAVLRAQRASLLARLAEVTADHDREAELAKKLGDHMATALKRIQETEAAHARDLADWRTAATAYHARRDEVAYLRGALEQRDADLTELNEAYARLHRQVTELRESIRTPRQPDPDDIEEIRKRLMRPIHATPTPMGKGEYASYPVKPAYARGVVYTSYPAFPPYSEKKGRAGRTSTVKDAGVGNTEHDGDASSAKEDVIAACVGYTVPEDPKKEGETSPCPAS